VEALLFALKIQEGQQVELFGESTSLDEALSKLGVTPEEYASYKQYSPTDSMVSSILKDLKVAEVDVAEQQSRASLFAFEKVLLSQVGKALAKNEKEMEMNN